jgi:lipoprotein NlpD
MEAVRAPRTRPKPSSRGYVWPARGRVLTYYGEETELSGEKSRGIDIQVSPGQQVVAAKEGKVCFASEGFFGHGKVVILEHRNGTATYYAHVDRILVENGALVEQGQPIAVAGRSGRATRPKLHFRIVRLPAGRPCNPLQFLPR